MDSVVVHRKPPQFNSSTLDRMLEDLLFTNILSDGRELQWVINKLWPILICEQEVENEQQQPIDFAEGHLYCSKAQNNLQETFEVFERMEKYYNSYGLVKHWKQHTLESGGFIESKMKIRDALWQIKEGWIEKASFVREP